MKRLDIQGMTFGRLVAIKPIRTQRVRPNGRVDNEIKWLCNCKCGMTTMASASDLRSGRKQSCGCLHNELASKRFFKHGGSNRKERLYDIWIAMKQRCNYVGCEHRKNYSMKGIKVCNEWENDYSAFKSWSYANGFYEQPKGTPHKEILSIDRIDPNKDYSPDNCQWISCDENLRKMFIDRKRGDAYANSCN